MTNFESIEDYLRGNKKRWLVTGVAGFIGSNLAEYLLSTGQVVVGMDNFLTGKQANVNHLRALGGDNFIFHIGDICNISDCQKAVEGVSYVLHQAALGSVPRSIEDPIKTNYNNVTGFLNILVAAQEANVERFVYACSSSVYGDHPDLPKQESVIGNPLSPYAVTKRVNELYAQVFGRVYNMNTIGLRYFNVFGARQDPDGAYAAVIPKWISSLIKGETVFINGDGETSRDFCYIQNVVQANILAATTQNVDAYNEVFNIALNDTTTLNDLFYALRDGLIPFYPHLKGALPSYRDFRKGDVRHSTANIEKAKKLLGFKPEYTVKQGIELAMDWYRKHLIV